MALKSLEDLFIHELSDIQNAEKQLTRALPRMARAASNPKLSKIFESHLQETTGQIERIDQLVDKHQLRLKRVKCHAMEGLIEEGREVIDEIAEGPVLDAALIAAAQKVEHYEIASYGTLCALAAQLGHQDAVKLLKATLDEEKAADRKLTELAESSQNEAAAKVKAA